MTCCAIQTKPVVVVPAVVNTSVPTSVPTSVTEVEDQAVAPVMDGLQAEQASPPGTPSSSAKAPNFEFGSPIPLQLGASNESVGGSSTPIRKGHEELRRATTADNWNPFGSPPRSSKAAIQCEG